MEKILSNSIDFEGPFPEQRRRLRLGVVGGGRIAQTQAMAARMTGRWDVVAGALSSDPMRSKERANLWHIDEARAYHDFDEMVEKELKRSDGVDAVMITTPNNMHYPAAKVFLESGIDVICDKPLTNTIEEAKDLKKVVDKSNCVFAVCYTMSCYPMIRQAQEIVRSGILGAINQIHVEFMQDWMTPENAGDAPHVKWRLDPKISGPTSCVGDIGTHAAHLAQFVSGLKMVELRADFHVCGHPKPLEDTVFMTTKYEGNIPGTLMATRQAPGNRGGLRLRIFGSKGGLEWDMENAETLKLNVFGQPDQVLTRGHGHGVSPRTERFVRTGRGFPEGLIEAWANLYTEFALAVSARKDGIETPNDWLGYPKISEGVEGVKFIEASVRSNQEKAWAVI